MGKPKTRHNRTSTKGKVFPAGRGGAKRKKTIMKQPLFEISQQTGFADGHECYTVEKNGEIMHDEDGNNWHFETYDEAQ